MTIIEKAAYLKGMADALGMTDDSREGRLWRALNGLLSDMAHELEDLKASHLDMADALEDLSEELDELSGAEPLYGDLDEALDDEDALFGEDFDEDEDDEASSAQVLYDLSCPVCGGELTIDEDMLALGAIDCPACGETLAFDLGDEE